MSDDLRERLTRLEEQFKRLKDENEEEFKRVEAKRQTGGAIQFVVSALLMLSVLGIVVWNSEQQEEQLMIQIANVGVLIEAAREHGWDIEAPD